MMALIGGTDISKDVLTDYVMLMTQRPYLQYFSFGIDP